MLTRFSARLLLIAIALCAAAAPSPKAKPVRTQFAFVHFKNERAIVTVNGKAMFDKVVPAASVNWPYGLTAVAQIALSACADIIVATKRQQVAKRICKTVTTKSIVIDGGPPLTIEAKDEFQGDD